MLTVVKLEKCLKCGSPFERIGGKVYCDDCGNAKKNRARVKVARALKDGTLEKEPCYECGSEIVQAHHDDYSKPLDVRWLCPNHHPKADTIRRWSYVGHG